MGRRLADEQEMPAHRPNRLADRLAGVEVVAQIDGMEPCVGRAVGGEPTSRRHALAVLLVVPVLRHNDLWLQRNDPAMARRPRRRGPQRMEIFGGAAAAFARRAARTMQLRRAVIFRAVECDQHMMPQPTKSRETAASFQHFERMGKMRIEAFRLHRVQHIPNMVVAWDLTHPKQRLAVRATMAVPVRQVPLMGQKRRALHASQPVREPSDLKGVKIRIQPGAVFSASFRACGAIPVVMDLSEVYIGISQKTVGGVELPVLSIVSSKIYEGTKFAGLTNHVYNAGALMASKVKFDRLEAAHRNAIRDAAAEIQPLWRATVAEKTQEGRAFCAQKGMQIDDTNFAAFRAAMAPVYDEFRDKIGAELVSQVMKAVAA